MIHIQMDMILTKLVLLCVLQLSIAENECEPTIDSPAAIVAVIKGQTAILPCSIDNLCHYRAVWTEQWGNLLTLDERRITYDTRFSIERPNTRAWNLHIKDTNSTDQGEYKCQVNYNPVQTKRVMLIVLEEK